MIALSTVLHYNHALKGLNINRPVPQHETTNSMDEIAQHYAIMLSKNRGLEELHMQKQELRDYGTKWLSEKLFENYKLVHLDLSW